MGFVLPAGVVNTDSLYISVPAAPAPLGPYIKQPSAQTLVVVDFFPSGATPVVSYTFAVDVTSNPQLVVSFPKIDDTGHFLSFLLSGGLAGQQYNITISIQYKPSPDPVTVGRVSNLLISIPSSGDECEAINPVPAIYSQLPLWGGGYVNSAVRIFWGTIPPNAPNVLDQWYDTAHDLLYEYTTDGTTAKWLPWRGPPGPVGGAGASSASIGLTPPASPVPGTLWFDTSGAQMYIFFDDGSSQQWVTVVNQLSIGGGGPGPVGAPVNTAPPVVTGTATAGSTLNTTDGSWSPAPTSFTYQWKRNGTNIAGATLNSYLLTTAEASTTVSCTVTAINSGGSSSASSNSLAILPTAPVASASPVISGTASLGSTLTTTDGTWSGGPTFTYLWQRNGVTIAGATAATYVVAGADLGFSINSVVTATNAAGSASAGSNTLAIPIFPATPVALFSVRKVGAGYAGKCLKVRRTSDSVQQDIGFGANGFIDMVAANTFAGGALLYVTKWYDQSGNGLDVTQVNPGAEPLLATINGRAYLSCQGSVGSILSSAAVGTFALTGDHTIGAVTQLNSDLGQVPVGCTDGSAGWAFFYNGVASGPGPQPGKNVFWTPGGSVTGTFDMFSKMPTRMVTTRAGTALKIYANGTLGGSGTITTITASTEVLRIGSYAHFGLNYEGLIGEVYFYSSALTDPVRLAIDANQAIAFPDTGFLPPYNGVSCVQFGLSEQISFGNILNYEYTQPWTAWGAIQMYGTSPPAIAGGIVFSNVTAPSDPAFPGYEMWVDNTGFMRVRLIHDANALNMIGRAGFIFLADGKKHMLCATYDGSGTVAGIKLYVDGVLDPGRDEGTVMSGSIIKAGQAMFVGTQQNEGGFNFTGTIGHVQLDNVVRSAAYIAPIKNGVIPPQDANTVWRLALTASSGTTVVDSAAVPHNGTLTSGNMWVP